VATTLDRARLGQPGDQTGHARLGDAGRLGQLGESDGNDTLQVSEHEVAVETGLTGPHPKEHADEDRHAGGDLGRPLVDRRRDLRMLLA
jgi:hypothetical protein